MSPTHTVSFKANLCKSLSNPGKPIHILYDRAAPREHGWTDADIHARKAGDRVVNAATRIATPFLGAFVVTKQALARPGAQKITVLPAPFIGLIGGTLLGAAGFGFDALHVALHLGGAAGNALYAVGHNGFEALYEDARGVFRGAEVYAEASRRSENARPAISGVSGASPLAQAQEAST